METPAGRVIHYFSQLGIAVIDLCSRVNVGDTLRFESPAGRHVQLVESIEVQNHKVRQASPGVRIAIPVSQPVHPGDSVILIIDSAETLQNLELWQLLTGTHQAIAYTYERVEDIFTDRTGIDRRGAGMLVAALTFEPESATAARLQVRVPYVSAFQYESGLRELASAGLMEEVSPGEFKLTARGRSEARTLLDRARKAAAKADPLPKDDSRYLAFLVRRIVDASAAAPEPPGKWSISLAKKLHPPQDPPLPYLEQLLSCLAAYRDDSHLAAWQQTGLSALELDCLTRLWSGEAASFTGLAAGLERRGQTPEAVAAAVRSLSAAGYVEAAADLTLTVSGRRLRESVEETTDRYFFVPWACLDDDQRASLGCLAKRLKLALEQKYLK